MRETTGFFGALALFALLVCGAVYGTFFLYRDVAPRYQETDRKIFEQSPSYVQGKVQHLTRLKLAYERAETEDDKPGRSEELTSLKETILTEAATVDEFQLSGTLQQFLRRLRHH